MVTQEKEKKTPLGKKVDKANETRAPASKEVRDSLNKNNTEAAEKHKKDLTILQAQQQQEKHVAQIEHQKLKQEIDLQAFETKAQESLLKMQQSQEKLKQEKTKTKTVEIQQEQTTGQPVDIDVFEELQGPPEATQGPIDPGTEVARMLQSAGAGQDFVKLVNKAVSESSTPVADASVQAAIQESMKVHNLLDQGEETPTQFRTRNEAAKQVGRATMVRDDAFKALTRATKTVEDQGFFTSRKKKDSQVMNKLRLQSSFEAAQRGVLLAEEGLRASSPEAIDTSRSQARHQNIQNLLKTINQKEQIATGRQNRNLSKVIAQMDAQRQGFILDRDKDAASFKKSLEPFQKRIAKARAEIAEMEASGGDGGATRIQLENLTTSHNISTTNYAENLPDGSMLGRMSEGISEEGIEEEPGLLSDLIVAAESDIQVSPASMQQLERVISTKGGSERSNSGMDTAVKEFKNELNGLKKHLRDTVFPTPKELRQGKGSTRLDSLALRARMDAIDQVGKMVEITAAKIKSRRLSLFKSNKNRKFTGSLSGSILNAIPGNIGTLEKFAGAARLPGGQGVIENYLRENLFDIMTNASTQGAKGFFPSLLNVSGSSPVRLPKKMVDEILGRKK